MSLLFDIISFCSIVGIWPRFVEPWRLLTSTLSWQLKKEAAHLDGLVIAHLTDLHFFEGLPQKFLDKIVSKTMDNQPDIILFSGDFICHSQLPEEKRLQAFLERFWAPLGCFCILGNHDFSAYVSLNQEGVFDVMKQPHPLYVIYRFLQLLATKENTPSSYRVSKEAAKMMPQEKLLSVLQKSPFTLLENRTKVLPLGINITGLGEYAVARFHPEEAFQGYDPRYPGIVLTHHPDTFPELLSYPGDLILAGHTHGEQLHFPFLPKVSRKISRLRTPYTRGLFEKEGKKLYVNRGLGAPKPFRLFSPPELLIIKAVSA